MDGEFTHTAPPLQTTMGGERVSYGNSSVREGCDNPGGLWVKWMCVHRGPLCIQILSITLSRDRTQTHADFTLPEMKGKSSLYCITKTFLWWCSHCNLWIWSDIYLWYLCSVVCLIHSSESISEQSYVHTDS